MSLLWRRRRDLHPEQIHAIQGLAPNGRFLLVGPPGSGKTSILLHRGQYLRLPPHNLTNVRLLTFSRTLREFIAISGDDRFPPELVDTFKGFVDQVFKVYHAPSPQFTESTSLSEQNRIRAANAIEIIEREGPRLGFDALLVDEIQDLSAEEIRLVGKLSHRLMLVGDSRQKLFEPVGAFEEAEAQNCEEITLKHHFRISPQICRVADSILLPGNFRMSEYCHYQGPTPTVPIAKGSLSRVDQLSNLAELLDLQLDTYNDPGDLIGVITWGTDDCDIIAEHLHSIPRFAEITRVFHSGISQRRFGAGCRICVVTLQSCKGLEFRALHWLFADEYSHFITRERAYTVVTRAKSSLTLYHNNSLVSFLAAALPPPARRLFEDDDE